MAQRFNDLSLIGQRRTLEVVDPASLVVAARNLVDDLLELLVCFLACLHLILSRLACAPTEPGAPQPPVYARQASRVTPHG